MNKLFFTLLILFGSYALRAQQNPFQVTGKGSVTLTNGEVQNGEIKFHRLENFIHFFKEFAAEEVKISIKDIKKFAVGDSIFYTKLTKGGEILLSKNKTFVLLKSHDEGKIKLFERLIIESEGNLAGTITDATDKLKVDYFIELPENQEEVYSTTGSKFLPNFSKKVSAIFADCPELSEKIAKKQEGYVEASPKLGFGMIKKTINDATQQLKTGEKKTPVWETIINEYNNCTLK